MDLLDAPGKAKRPLLASLTGTALSSFGSTAAGIFSGLVIARSLKPTLRGELAAGMIWPSIFILVGDLGLGFAFSYYAARRKQSFDALWTLTLLIGLGFGSALAIIGCFIMPLVLKSLTPASISAMRIAMLGVPFVAAGGYQAYLMLGAGRLESCNVVRMTAALAYSGMAVSIAAAGLAGVRNYAMAWLAAQTLAATVATILVVKHYRPSWKIERDLFGPLFKYGAKSYLSSLAGQTSLRADQAVLSLYVSPAQLGYYVIAVAAAGAPGPLFGALAMFGLSRSLGAGSAVEAARSTARQCKLGVFLTVPVIAIGIAVTPWLLPLVFGRAYAPAVSSAQILLAAALLQGLNSVLANGLRGAGHPGLGAISEVCGMVATICLLLLLLPVMGIFGAAVTSLCAYAIVFTAQSVFLVRTSGLPALELASAPLNLKLAEIWARRRQSRI